MRAWRADIGQLADKVLDQYCEYRGARILDELIPVQVTEIADALYDLRVRYVSDMASELSACLDADTKLVEINMLEPMVRRRFSLAHEIGHFIRHAAEGGANTFHRCASAAMEKLRDLKADDLPDRIDYGEMKRRADQAAVIQDLLQREKEANAFAADLLMPSDVVIALATRHRNSPQQMAKLFGVSVESMTWKMTRLRLIQGFSKQRLLPWNLIGG
jgi:Zn-dependent peptidase ImmA (M78 family)